VGEREKTERVGKKKKDKRWPKEEKERRVGWEKLAEQRSAQ
jgi:hypothetical protein